VNFPNQFLLTQELASLKSKIALQKNGLQSGQIPKKIPSETKFHQMKQNLKSLKQNLNQMKQYCLVLLCGLT